MLLATSAGLLRDKIFLLRPDQFQPSGLSYPRMTSSGSLPSVTSPPSEQDDPSLPELVALSATDSVSERAFVIGPRPLRLWENLGWQFLTCLSLASCALMMPILAGFGGPPGIVRSVLGFGALGSILAQGCLLAAWLAWGDLPFGYRLQRHWIFASLLCVIWLVGFLLAAWEGEALEVAFTAAMTVPLISLAAQFPLWCVRQIFGWRLVRASNGNLINDEGPWTIRDLFWATLIVAVAFGIARLSPAALQAPNFWIAWCISGTVACVVCSITILPAGVLLLRLESFRHGVVYGWVYAASVVVTLWLIVAVVRFLGFGPLPPYFVFIGLSCLTLAFAGTVILAAMIARQQGYRLVTRTRRTIPSWTVQTVR